MLIRDVCQGVLQRTSEAGGQFTATRSALFERTTGTGFAAITDNGLAFGVSPAALVHWALAALAGSLYILTPVHENIPLFRVSR